MARLDLAECVSGQLSKTEADFVEKLKDATGCKHEYPREFGFDIESGLPYGEEYIGYQILQDEWEKQIRMRRTAA